MDEFLKRLLDGMDAIVRIKQTHYLYCKVKPEAKQSVKRGRFSFYTQKGKKEYVKKLRDSFWAQYGLRKPPITGAVKVTIVFAFPWLKSSKSKNRFFGWEFCGKRQDIDNLEKGTLDAMTGFVFKDDSQVVVLQAMKIYARDACIVVRVDEISEKF